MLIVSPFCEALIAAAMVENCCPGPTVRIRPPDEFGSDVPDHPDPFHSHHCPCALSAKRLPPRATSSSVAEPPAAECPFKRIRFPEALVVLSKVQVPAVVI